MAQGFSIEGFANLAGMPIEEIERYRDEGLLDPDGDGVFDDFDALRLRFIMVGVTQGQTPEQISARLREGHVDFPGGELLFPTGRTVYPLEEASEISGFSIEQIEALRTAVGLPGAVVEEADLEVFRAIRTMLDIGFTWEAVIEAGRVLGDAMKRFTQVEMALVHEYLHEPLRQAGADEDQVASQSQQVLDSFLPYVDPMIQFVHRQHLVRAAAREALQHLESAQGAGRQVRVAVMFVDLSSFTSLAYVHGDEAAAQILDRFDDLVRTLGIEHSGTLAKQIGDAFMMVFDDPGDALGFAVALDEAASKQAGFPAMRVGIHAGPVLYRVGDYVGSTVNIASRLASAAMPNEIVVTDAVASAAPRVSIEVGEVGVRMIRGIGEPLTLYKVQRPGVETGERDPVCGMVVRADAGAALTRGSRRYLFCSEDCLRRFLQAPERYETAPA